VKTKSLIRMVVVLVALFALAVTASAQDKAKATGKLDKVSEKFKTFALTTPGGSEVITFTDKTELKNSDVDSIAKMVPGSDLEVEFTVKEGRKVADVVTLMVVKVDPKELITAEQLAQLLEKGPQAEKFALFDSRPGPMFAEGHLPQAISLPYVKWEEVKDKALPQDKNMMLIFYCAGVT
jgi:hypothetical protein